MFDEKENLRPIHLKGASVLAYPSKPLSLKLAKPLNHSLQLKPPLLTQKSQVKKQVFRKKTRPFMTQDA